MHHDNARAIVQAMRGIRRNPTKDDLDGAQRMAEALLEAVATLRAMALRVAEDTQKITSRELFSTVDEVNALPVGTILHSVRNEPWDMLVVPYHGLYEKALKTPTGDLYPVTEEIMDSLGPFAISTSQEKS